MGKIWRIIFDGASEGPYNMAKDEAMLACYPRHRKPTLRVYSWQKPCITLGYSQEAKVVVNLRQAHRRNIAVVRRITGGAAIIHHRELTYSLVCGVGDLPLPGEVKLSYKVLNSFIIDFYNRLNLKACFASDTGLLKEKNGKSARSPDRESPTDKRSRPNLCFLSFEPFDILIEGRKIGGNAQRRCRDIIFQHGSIPQELPVEIIADVINGPDKTKINKAVCLDELLDRPISFIRLQTIFVDSFLARFKVQSKPQEIEEDEKMLLNKLLEDKYQSRRWNLDNEKICLVR